MRFSSLFLILALLAAAIPAHAATPSWDFNPGPGTDTVAATSTARLVQGAAGSFRIAIVWPTSSPVTVTYTISGSAKEGVDYIGPSAGTFTTVIPAGASAVTIPVRSLVNPAIATATYLILTINAVSQPVPLGVTAASAEIVMVNPANTGSAAGNGSWNIGGGKSM